MRTIFNTILLGGALALCSCDKDDDTYTELPQPPASKVTQSVFDKNLTTTTREDVSFRCRFKDGGDKLNNISCTVHWRTYSSKPTKTPTASDMTRHEAMRTYASTSSSTTFDKNHTGFNGGTFVYYYFECRNSKYTTKTNVTYTIVKR